MLLQGNQDYQTLIKYGWQLASHWASYLFFSFSIWYVFYGGKGRGDKSNYTLI